ncbi:MAG: NADP-dependent oxidoreductase [Novosphingobium sp.]
MIHNRYVRLRSRPCGKIGQDHFELSSMALPSPEQGQLLLKNRLLSIDPGVRNLLGAKEGYLPPIAVGAPVTCSVLGEVIQSRHDAFAEGDLVVGRGMMGEYSVVTPDALCWKVDKASAHTLSNALGVLGNTGRTAYFGLLEIGRPEPGGTVLVSGASGSVGSLVGQIARIKGCRAVGIAGGEQKCRMLRDEFGFDAAIDYLGKSDEELHAAIVDACPDGIDVFFDNVGGRVLDSTLPAMNFGGRVVLCGLISQYDGASPPVMANLFMIVAKALHVRGFLLPQFADRYDEAIAFLEGAIARRELYFREEILDGLEAAIPAFVRQFNASTAGKTMVQLS